MGEYTTDFISRFWNKVNKTETCWLWTASLSDDGYGRIRCRGKLLAAHRVSFELANGPVPDGHEVCHNCPNNSDNPACVNPAHLFSATHTDNIKDMYRKGRGNKARGENQHSAKLTADKVKKIRELYKLGYYQQTLAEMFGVRQVAISRIICGTTWKHIQ